MLKRFKPFEAPQSYHFVDPDTGYQYTADSLIDLIARIDSYREQNQLSPIEALKDTIENYLCGFPQNCGKCEAVPLRRGWLQTIRGGIALVEYVVFKRFATQAEAERRADVCLKCPNNVIPSEDRPKFDAWADNLAELCTEGRKVPAHAYLGMCSVCECNLRAKVFFGSPISLTEAEQKEMEKVGCWQLQFLKKSEGK